MDTQLMRELLDSIMQERNTMTTALNDRELSLVEFIALGRIAGNRIDSPGNIYADDLQRSLFVSKPAISQMLKSLENAGYIKRDINMTNRRKLNVILTDRGREIYEGARQRYRAMLDRIIQAFGEEKTQQMIALNREFIAVVKETIRTCD